jgi:hypothetical protein
MPGGQAPSSHLPDDQAQGVPAKHPIQNVPTRAREQHASHPPQTCDKHQRHACYTEMQTCAQRLVAAQAVRLQALDALKGLTGRALEQLLLTCQLGSCRDMWGPWCTPQGPDTQLCQCGCTPLPHPRAADSSTPGQPASSSHQQTTASCTA